MKRIALMLVIFFVSLARSFGQDIDLPPDSVTVLLCDKWEVDYALVGGMKIGRQPDAAEINYEFKKDKTFVVTSNKPSDKIKGTWNYDPKKKIIKLVSNGRSNTSIISLKKGEFVMLLDKDKSMPADMGDTKIVYKIRTQ